MQVLQSIVQWVLNLGANVFVPLVMFIIGMIAGLKFKKSFVAALTLGVAFSGMTLVVNYMTSVITPAAKAMSKAIHVSLTATDLGWTGVAAVTWTSKVAFLFFPLLLVVNFIMLALNWTKTLNVDMWNVWNKIFTYVLVYYMSGSMLFGFLVATLQIVFELKAGDMWQKTIKDLTGIPGVTVPHFITLFAVLLNPLNKILDFIPFFNKPFDAEHMQKKLGMWGRNDVMGFIIGILLGFAGGYGLSKSLTLGVEAACAMALFPMISKLFMEALNPIASAMGDFMKRHFKDREVFIGVDWPILAGRSELWVTMIILVPVELLFAVILPKNNVLPFAGIINLSFANAALLLTGANLMRMLALGIITTPIFLYGGTYFAPMITKLAKTTHAVKVPAGSQISWSTFEGPDFRFIFGNAFSGKWWAWVLVVVWILGFIWLYRTMMKAPLPSQRYVVAGNTNVAVADSPIESTNSVTTSASTDAYKKMSLNDLDGQDFSHKTKSTLNKTVNTKSSNTDGYKNMNLDDLDGQDFKGKHK
ncbi:PTS transporter subunit IIC [Lactobacillus johnsonii]|uniref:PTS galactitol transporter subunit IIC n=1 Tax=Lactobacillus johnsonii TaxID=33959 RepID=UPI0028ED73A4|nr:PTS transporter subunit IIC [Lactobacillus johnsonii]MDT9606036.1 PTS transporter subunit IIC [Lactobacillus johnsonii]